MLFNSWQFLLFLPLVIALYWLLPNRYRWILLLLASYYFYMSWNAKYVFLILGTTVVTYYSAIYIERSQKVSAKKLILIASLMTCLGVLVLFKYFNFFFGLINSLLRVFTIGMNPFTLKLLLPVGISFYTFQTLSYVIDVYRGEVEAEKHFGIYATFISFFPQLVAGPIERSRNLLPQIKAEHRFDEQLALDGAKLMLLGYFKKMVVADNFATYVDTVYDSIGTKNGFSLLLATVLFAMQIYCDFSGYSDIARGVGKLMGIRLMENFKAPYLSYSLHEFWSRWHISLSTWLKDYVYIPLGGNRKGKIRVYLNLLITFLVSGLWHGANLTFVVWGGVHGIGQIIENIFGLSRRKSKSFVKIVRTFCTLAFVAMAWVFFRAQSLSEANYILSHMLYGVSNPVTFIKTGLSEMSIGATALATIVGIYLVPLFFIDAIAYRNNEDASLAMNKWRRSAQWFIYVIIACIIIFFSKKGVATEFVYFQF